MNKGKYETLDKVMIESVRVVNLFIDELWTKEKLLNFVDFKVDTWLGAGLQQCLGKQAIEIIKTQQKKHFNNRTKPIFTKETLTLDERFLDIQESDGAFDIWFKFWCIGDKTVLKLPSHKHKHFNDLVADDWTVKKSCQLRRVDGFFYLNLFLEKQEPKKKTKGKTVGFDCGYKKLLVDSNGNEHDVGLEQIYEKIARKKQGSKGFKRALRHRDQAINESVKAISLSNVKEAVVEGLKDVKRNSKGKIRKSFNNKLQRWSYPKVLDRLVLRCENEGVLLTKVNPAYTSQKCSYCGETHRASRVNSLFHCVSCGMEMDADHNAAINISHMGVYGAHA